VQTVTLWGLSLVVIAGIFAGGCAAPIKVLRHYRFEHWALVAALVGQLLLPWLALLLFCPGAWSALQMLDAKTVLTANLFAFAWGIANVLAGLCLLRIGFSLTVGLLTGIGLPLGVLLPVVIRASGHFANTPGLGTPSGLLLLTGVGIMLAAVILVARAGFGRDALQGNLPGDAHRFRGGLIMASVAGLLQVGLSFAFIYSQGPISTALTAHGANDVTAGIGVWAITLPGGALVNVAYPVWLLTRHRSWSAFGSAQHELLLSVLMGVLFFAFFVSMGTGMRWLGALGASVGFGVYQGLQIATSQAVGFASGEWRGMGSLPRRQMLLAVILLLVAVAIIAMGRAIGP
jgi:hypothetical protein